MLQPEAGTAAMVPPQSVKGQTLPGVVNLARQQHPTGARCVVLFPFVVTAFTAGLYQYFFLSDASQKMCSWMRALTAWPLMLAAAIILS